MSCELINGIVGVCDYSSSGVERLWLANKLDIDAVVYNTGNTITGVTMVTGTTFFEYVPALDSCTFNDDLVVNGSRRNFLQSINFGVGSLTEDVLVTLETLGLANVVAFVKTSEGDYRALGFKGSGLRATVMTEASGTNAGNDGAIAVTLSGSNKGKASYVAESVITTLAL